MGFKDIPPDQIDAYLDSKSVAVELVDECTKIIDARLKEFGYSDERHSSFIYGVVGIRIMTVPVEKATKSYGADNAHNILFAKAMLDLAVERLVRLIKGVPTP